MWRSLLFIPVLEERFVAKAADRGASAVVLDLEASIAEARKREARSALPALRHASYAWRSCCIQPAMLRGRRAGRRDLLRRSSALARR